MGLFFGEIYIMIVVDYRSKWFEVIVFKCIISESIVIVFVDIFVWFGNLKVLIMDNGC